MNIGIIGLGLMGGSIAKKHLKNIILPKKSMVMPINDKTKKEITETGTRLMIY